MYVVIKKTAFAQNIFKKQFKQNINLVYFIYENNILIKKMFEAKMSSLNKIIFVIQFNTCV